MNKIEKLLNELYPDGVEFKELKEVSQILNWYAFQSWKYCEEWIRVIRISDVQKGKMSNKDLKYYPVETIKEIGKYLLQENDLVMSLTGNVGRVAMLSKIDLPAGLNQRVACIRANEEKILTRFLFHFFDQDSFENEAMANATWGGQKNMSTTWLLKFQIPIPPIEIQKEIVKILDTFTLLEAELEAELEARKKQYEYYRSELLNSKNIELINLGDVWKVSMCKRVFKDETKSIWDIPFYKIWTFWKEADSYISNELYNDYKNRFSFPKKWDILISASWTIWRTVVYNWEDAYFQDSNIVWIDNDETKVNNKYLFYIYQIIKWQTDTGWVISRLYNDNIRKAKIPVPYKNWKPDLEKQQEIVAILDKFDALVNDISVWLPAELKARRQQYEYYRNKLLTFKVLEK